ncbi:MAG TPA: hypothetical protein VMR46_01330 [Candidatus Paceibacterota bacterium]|nr:hypothetical protein [Candidatus Paceibacterota bacterium]
MDPIQEEKKFERTDIWREGTWLDLWSVVHFLSGLSIGLGFYFLQIGAVASLLLALVLLIAYEMWERLMQMEETFANGCMDVVVGMFSFLLAFFISAPLLPGVLLVLAFGAVLAVDVSMSIFGWRASQKAAVLKERMLARYAAERARLLKQKLHLQEKFQHKI